MTKIVINTCFGGFGLSPLAVKEYLKLKGKECYFYIRKDFNSPLLKCDIIHILPSSNIYFFTKDHGDLVTEFTDEDVISIYDISRDDPDLVTVIESLNKTANGVFANLKVVEIPDDVAWEIDNHQGIESIEEVHRSWV